MISKPNLSVLIDKTTLTKKDTLKSNTPKYIILHSTEKYPDIESLYDLHTKTYRWKGIGYHVFVSQGEAYLNREYNLEGAHCLGFNFNSLGLCVYAKNHNPTDIDMDIAKNIIGDIRSQYGWLPIFSHTLAQIKYINKLSKKTGILLNVQDDLEIKSNQEFEDIKRRFADFLDKNSLEKHPYLKAVITHFKNCPGDGFYQLITELNQHD
jgi:hypothetical protein